MDLCAMQIIRICIKLLYVGLPVLGKAVIWLRCCLLVITSLLYLTTGHNIHWAGSQTNKQIAQSLSGVHITSLS